MTLERLAKLLTAFFLRNGSENAPQKDQVMEKSLKKGLVPTLHVSSAWSSQFLGSLCTFCCTAFLILNYCTQKFHRSSNLLDTEVRNLWPCFQLRWPHWRDHRADLPSPALTPPCSEDTCLLWQDRHVPVQEGQCFCCLCYGCPEHWVMGSQLGVELSSFLAEKKEWANYQTTWFVQMKYSLHFSTC